MYYLLIAKKFFVKLLTCFIFPEKLRKNARNFLFYFSFEDYIRFKTQNFHIVSLGCDCLPRVLTTAIKLKPRKIYGEKTLPFGFINDYGDIDNDYTRFCGNTGKKLKHIINYNT